MAALQPGRRFRLSDDPGMNTQRKGYIRPVDFKHGHVDMSHGSGGRAMAQLIDELFQRAFDNEWLRQANDQAAFTVPPGRLVMAIDADVRIDHLVDEDLLALAQRVGTDDPSLVMRVQKAVSNAAATGASIVVCTCTTIGAAAEKPSATFHEAGSARSPATLTGTTGG